MSLTAQFSPPVTGITRSVRNLKSPPFSLRVFPVYTDIRTPEMRNLKKSSYLVAKAIEQRRDTAGSESESEATPSPAEESGNGGDKEVEINAIGAEIKAAMEQRKAAEEEKGKNEFLSGVAEEVKEIEWPAFQKVLGTTGVVLGVIAGSSVVLLTVNFLLAELSDRVFIGKGVQDFFS
ncbi:Protein translocase complex SecE/Sec61-gamma subunit [Arabidopsis suecica]|uniref:Protein translocase complex SecE/Sec61-gamma subunit n=1 Tax=Arabidopsis suecica TaxID=45249 RepID=A0A8T1YMU4_ARASU|nr:Protein translocase complex SecE/Sec61-gamma subunit [Arabidopsis suecica]